MMGEDMHKFGQSRLDRNEFPMNGGLGMVNPGSRQIYLTFPADSTFREEDVSNYSRYICLDLAICTQLNALLVSKLFLNWFFKYLWTSSKCEDSISTEENV